MSDTPQVAPAAAPAEVAQPTESIAQAAPKPTMQLVGRDGAIHDVPIAQAHQAVASGQFGWVHGSRIPVVDPTTGLVTHVASEHASDVLSRMPGARLASNEEAAHQAKEQKYGSFGGMAAAAGEGAARGLTAGLSDAAATELAGLFGGVGAREKVRAHLASEQEVNPGIAMGSEIVGAVAPMLFGDVAGAADIIGSIPRGIDAAGSLAGQIAGKLVGTGAESLLGKVGQKAITGAAKALVEGGLFGAGQEVSAATLQNRDLTAENVLASAGHGALLAGAIGGVLSGLEPLAGKAMSSLREHTPFEEVLGGAADEQYIRALSPKNQSIITEMKERFGGKEAPRRIADRLRTEGIVTAGDNVETIAAKAAKAETSAVEGLTETVERVGSKGVKLEDALTALEDRAKQFDRELGFHSAAGEIRSKMKELIDVYRPHIEASLDAGQKLNDFQIPIQDLLQQRRGLEKTINWNTDTVLAQGRKAVGRTLEDVIMNAGERAAKEGGDAAWKADYLAAKTRFSELRFINDTAQGSVTARLRNRAMSPSDYLASMAGSSMFGGAGHALGGGVGGMVMGALHHQVRERGNATMAVLLDKLGTLSGLSEMQVAATKKLDGVLNTALGANAGRIAPMRGDYSPKRFAKEASRIASLAAAPQEVDKHLGKQVAPIAGHAPEIADAVKSKATNVVKFLGSKLPASYQEAPPTLTPNAYKKSASSSEMTDFLRSVDAVEAGPHEIIKHALRGNATMAEVDVLKNVYPSSFADAQSKVLEKCASRTKPLPFQTAMRLGLLFDVPTDASLAPEMVQQEQVVYAKKPAAPQPGASPRNRGSTQKPLKTPDMLAGMFESASGEDREKS